MMTREETKCTQKGKKGIVSEDQLTSSLMSGSGLARHFRAIEAAIIASFLQSHLWG